PRRRAGRAPEHETHQSLAVEREGERLAHPPVGEPRVTQVQRQVDEARPRDPPYEQGGDRGEPGHRLRLGGIRDQVHPAAPERVASAAGFGEASAGSRTASYVALTSAAVTAVPSGKRKSGRNRKTKLRESAISQVRASSGIRRPAASARVRPA